MRLRFEAGIVLREGVLAGVGWIRRNIVKLVHRTTLGSQRISRTVARGASSSYL